MNGCLGVRDLEELLDLTQLAAYQLMMREDFPARKVDHRWQVHVQDFEACVAVRYAEVGDLAR